MARPESGSRMWRRDQPQRVRFDPQQSEEMRRMQWRAAGAQFYPGGAYEDLMSLSHRGRGPKGYQRSDELLHELICEQLIEDPFIDARNVSVEVRGAEVTLRGTVDTREQKYLIEDIVADTTGVAEIHNQLGVGQIEEDD
jgi:hypothetical protein